MKMNNSIKLIGVLWYIAVLFGNIFFVIEFQKFLVKNNLRISEVVYVDNNFLQKLGYADTLGYVFLITLVGSYVLIVIILISQFIKNHHQKAFYIFPLTVLGFISHTRFVIVVGSFLEHHNESLLDDYSFLMWLVTCATFLSFFVAIGYLFLIKETQISERQAKKLNNTVE
ncbi:MAG: hypothetical protein ACRCUP_07580 [Mycoplasmatales bacterium]